MFGFGELDIFSNKTLLQKSMRIQGQTAPYVDANSCAMILYGVSWGEIHSRKLTWIPQMMGLGKGNSL